MSVETIITLISSAAAVCGIVFGATTYARNKRNDNREDGNLMAEIGYIKSGVDDIKRKQEKADQQHLEVITRLTAVEASAKQAHHRLDRMEGAMKNED